MDLACQIAIDATAMVSLEENGRREIDIKRYAKVEKVLMTSILIGVQSKHLNKISVTGLV